MLELLAVAAAGAAAGAANSVAGGGALITFPTMVALGLDFSTLTTRSTLASGLEYAFNVLRLRVVSG